MSKSKRMAKGPFLAIWCSVAVLALGVGVALEVSSHVFENILNTYVGKGQMHIDPVAGSEEWDTDYYGQSYGSSAAAGGNAEAAKAGEKVVEKVADEGMVLLKNKGGALPLGASPTVALLGRGAVDPVYGGSGSGNVDTTTCASPKKGLEAAGITVDADSYNFFSTEYVKYPRQAIVMDKYDDSTFFIGEIPTSAYTFTPVSSQTAVVFISRCGGEGLDLSTDLKRDSQTSASQGTINGTATGVTADQAANATAEVSHYADGQHELELSQEEKDMIEFAKANYAKTVVVLNESTTMEIGELKDDEGIDAIIWAGSPGSTGFNALGKILVGTVNPSGKTPDLYVRDFTADPTFQNFAINSVHEYTGIDESNIDAGVDGTLKAHFVQYEEGIYVGYRYYETRGSIDGDAWYQSAVAYPFGYGLSYTSFSKELLNTSVDGNIITMSVKVTNTGSVAGKEVVQLYYTAPYTEGGIEKSSTVLGDFAKTKLLAAGESDTVTVSIAIDEMASYDSKAAKHYVLDAGDYKLQIKENSHTVSKNPSNQDLEYVYHVAAKRVLDKRESDRENVTNNFDDVSEIFADTVTAGKALNFSRKDFAGTFPTGATADDAKADAITIEGKTIAQRFAKVKVADYLNSDDVAPTVGANNGLSVSLLRGYDYDDPIWDTLLDQLTDKDYTDMANYIVNNAYVVNAIESIGLPGGELHDGPQGFSTLMGKLNNVCAYMSEPLLAATFNKALASEMGEAIGEESLALNPRYNGWYGPAMNTHRSPFAGRNFEYYSEDGLLAGKIAANVCTGAAKKGLIVFIKHFALNDQETWRTAHLATWVNEQALRECYLKPFEIAVKETAMDLKYLDTNGVIHTKKMNGCLGVMSSFNYVGTTWAGGRHDLMTEVLRGEWGFRGFASSDFNLYNYMDAFQGCYAGTDLQLTWVNFKDRAFTDTTSPTCRLAMRTAVKNLAYAFANSNAMQGVAPGAKIWYDMSPWRIGFIVGECFLFVGAAAAAAWIVIRTLRVKKENA